jgi:hypothetical protein
MLTPVLVADEWPAAQDAEAWCEGCGSRLSLPRVASSSRIRGSHIPAVT